MPETDIWPQVFQSSPRQRSGSKCSVRFIIRRPTCSMNSHREKVYVKLKSPLLLLCVQRCMMDARTCERRAVDAV